MRDYDGKTAGERVADRRARLIAAGLELFGGHGYAGTSIRSVVRRSGLRDRLGPHPQSGLNKSAADGC